jgi:SAM-dependent methyltransferase
MTNTIIRTTHHLLSDLVTDRDIVVDATAGNGYDTVFLARRARTVYAFDTSADAIMTTTGRVREEGLTNVIAIHDSHERITDHVTGFKGVVFNLGYLPGSDKVSKTDGKTVVKALERVLGELHAGGFISVVTYPGHPGGRAEHDLVRAFFERVKGPTYEILEVHLPFQDNDPPSMFMLIKRKWRT